MFGSEHLFAYHKITDQMDTRSDDPRDRVGDIETIKIQMTRNKQAPLNDTSIGMMEYPIPRRLPTNTSIIPHDRYVTAMILNLSIP